MPASRPYINSMIHELEELAERNWGDRAVLQALQAELQHRSSGAAKSLAQKVDARIRVLPLDASSSRSNPHDNKNKEKNRSNSYDKNTNKYLIEKIALLEKKIDQMQNSEKNLRDQLDLEIEKRRSAENLARQNKSLTDYGRVHLADTAPGWLVLAARTAFRKQYHPDRYQDKGQRQRAHEVFVAADAIFDRLVGK